MTTLNFPSSPSVDDEYTFGSKTWVWNGSAWYLKQNQPLLILDLIKTVDGHNSGLDADLLDGNHASNYLTTTGNAASATVLQTARTINGVSFDGSANINIATKLTILNRASASVDISITNGLLSILNRVGSTINVAVS